MINKLTEKAKKYCAYTERCSQDVRQKLLRIGADESTISTITALLQKEGYLDDERFALHFANGKFQNNRWGKIKINAELIKRHIPESFIKKALDSINDETYQQCLSFLINKKIKEPESKQTNIVKRKVAAYCLQKGFEPDLVWKTINESYHP